MWRKYAYAFSHFECVEKVRYSSLFEWLEKVMPRHLLNVWREYANGSSDVVPQVLSEYAEIYRKVVTKPTSINSIMEIKEYNETVPYLVKAVSYTHLTLPTKRIV